MLHQRRKQWTHAVCVCGKRVGVNSIQCETCSYYVHGHCLGERGSLVRVAQGFVCKLCRSGGRKAIEEFCFEDVELECVGEFVYLGDMLNNTGGVEQAVTLGSAKLLPEIREQKRMNEY